MSEENKYKNTIRTPEGEIVVQGTGEVIGYVTDRGSERRAYDDEQKAKRSRTGAPLTYTRHDKGLPTFIDRYDKDIYGRSLSPSQKSQMGRLRKWQRKISIADYFERNLVKELAEINKICCNLNVSKSAYEEACIIYRNAVKKGLTKGRSNECFGAASIRLSCREYNLNKTLNEIVTAMKPGYEKSDNKFNNAKKEVVRDFGLIVRELNYYSKNKLFDGAKLIPKLVESSGNPVKVEDAAVKIYNAAKIKKLTSGRGPVGVAAAATYIAETLVNGKGLSEDGFSRPVARTQFEIAKTAKVTEVTIRNRYKELLEELTIESRH